MLFGNPKICQLVNYTKFKECFFAKYRFSFGIPLFGCNHFSIELQYHKKDDNRVTLCFFRVTHRFPRHVHAGRAEEKLFITSKALHRYNEIVNDSCESHVEAAIQFLCSGNWSFWREVSFGLR